MADVTGATRWHIVPPLLIRLADLFSCTHKQLWSWAVDPATPTTHKCAVTQMGHKCTTMEWWVVKQVGVCLAANADELGSQHTHFLCHSPTPWKALIKYIHILKGWPCSLLFAFSCYSSNNSYLSICTHNIGHKVKYLCSIYIIPACKLTSESKLVPN